MSLDVQRVDEGDYAVEPREGLDLWVDQEGRGHRCGVGHAGRLDHDGIQLELAGLRPRRELVDDRDQVLAHRAADAAVENLHDLLVRAELAALFDERVIDGGVSKLILDDRDLLTVRRREDVVEQRRLAGAEEAGEHRDRHARVVVVGGGGHSDRKGSWDGWSSSTVLCSCCAAIVQTLREGITRDPALNYSPFRSRARFLSRAFLCLSKCTAGDTARRSGDTAHPCDDPTRCDCRPAIAPRT
eukprot:scaffold104599_cov62-Phaeocystis_antarctica.AAC.1